MKNNIVLFLLSLGFASLMSAQTNNDSIHTNLDKIGEYTGGIEEYYLFNIANFNLPEISKPYKGTINLGFIIEPNGTISDITILRGLEKSIDEEAVNILKQTSGKWIPAEKNNVKVRSRFILPVLIDVAPQSEEITNNFDTPAKYKLGKEQLQKDILKNLKTSNKPKTNKGIIIVSFDVEVNGIASNFRIEKNTTGESEENILKGFKNLNSWIPAMLKNKPVKSRMTLPLNFSKNGLNNVQEKNVRWGY